MLGVIRLYKLNWFDKMKTQFNLTSPSLEEFFCFLLRHQKNIPESKSILFLKRNI